MRPRSYRVCVLAAISAAATLTLALPTSQATAEFKPSPTARYSVLGASGASDTAVRAAIAASGGTVTSVNRAIGLYTVTAPASGFVVDVSDTGAVYGAAHQRPIGHAPTDMITKPSVEREHATGAESVTSRSGTAAVNTDPLDDKLWGLRMVHADQARKIEPREHGVTVGVLDTGLDASNPDIAPNFSFGVVPQLRPGPDLDVDGPCEVAICLDPVGTDDGGHGTHVAGTIGAAANGTGVSGVAPNVTLGRAQGRPGLRLLLPGAGRQRAHLRGRCRDRRGQHVLLRRPVALQLPGQPGRHPRRRRRSSGRSSPAMRRGLATRTSTASRSSGRSATTTRTSGRRGRTSQPGLPARRRLTPAPIDNDTCLDLPVEGPHVIGVSALGPSGTKADYSNYGIEQISVSAPGGYFRDGFGTDSFRTPGNQILSTYPLKVLQEEGTGRRRRQHRCRPVQARSSRTARVPAAAGTTPTCRARRWRRRTPPASRR